jgi:replicative superfamily II helicase
MIKGNCAEIIDCFLEMIEKFDSKLYERAQEQVKLENKNVLEKTIVQSSSEEMKVYSKYLIKTRLSYYLKLFSRWKNNTNIPNSQLIKHICYQLISKQEPSLQKDAFEAIQCWREPFILPYVENINQILNDKTLKEGLIMFNISDLHEVIKKKKNHESFEDPIAYGHREKLIPLLSIIVFTKFFHTSVKKIFYFFFFFIDFFKNCFPCRKNITQKE